MNPAVTVDVNDMGGSFELVGVGVKRTKKKPQRFLLGALFVVCRFVLLI